MSGYSDDWGGPIDMWEEKQKECDFKTARIRLLEGDITRLEREKASLRRELVVERQNRDMYADSFRRVRGELLAVSNQLERERGCDWAGFDGGMG